MNYLSSNQFDDRMEFARSVVDGIRDAGGHIQATSVAKTINLCSPGDEICDGTPGGMPGIAHIMYGSNGMVNQAATFAANRL